MTKRYKLLYIHIIIIKRNILYICLVKMLKSYDETICKNVKKQMYNQI